MPPWPGIQALFPLAAALGGIGKGRKRGFADPSSKAGYIGQVVTMLLTVLPGHGTFLWHFFSETS